MRLNDPLITSFYFDNGEYNIDLSFDRVLDVYDYLNDETLRDDEKATICLTILLEEQEYEESKAIDLWNYIYKSFIYVDVKEAIQYDLKGNPMPRIDNKTTKVIDLERDAEFIYASFKQAYNIDLFQEQGRLHWSLFQSLLNGLPGNTIMQKIIQIRLWEPSKHDSDEYKKSMQELQDKYRLEEVDPLE